jgi:hypothetical protein
VVTRALLDAMTGELASHESGYFPSDQPSAAAFGFTFSRVVDRDQGAGWVQMPK